METNKYCVNYRKITSNTRKWEITHVTKVKNFPKFFSFDGLLRKISVVFLENKFLWLIPRKFLRNSRELDPELRDFSGIRVLRLSFWEIHDNFFGNFWEMLRTWSLIFSFFWKTEKENSFWAVSMNFSGIFSHKFLRIFLRKFLRNYQELVTIFTDFLRIFSLRSSWKFYGFLGELNKRLF